MTMNFDDRAFDSRMEALFRAHDFAQAGEVLLEVLNQQPGTLSKLCLGLERDAIRAENWYRLQCYVLTRDQANRSAAAIKLNYSGYTELSRGYEEGDSLPKDWAFSNVECQLLLDDRFPFSTCTLDEIMAAAPRDVAWRTGKFAGKTNVIDFVGLEQLQGAIAVSEAPFEHRVTASWYLALRWQETMATHIAEQGLPIQIPVLVGSHGMHTTVTVAHMPLMSAMPAAEDIPPRELSREELFGAKRAR